jgi:heme ABC exporter ATP-binding subunit CcmA
MDVSGPMVRLEGLTVRYGPFVAVNGLDLDLRPGEIVALVGPNGAGKSSTLRVLTGQRRPAAGTVTVAGHDLVREWGRVKRLFGYVPDRENHFEELTGRRNLRFFAGLYGAGEKRVDECLDAVELADAADLPVRHYSLGMRRKLLLARALLHRPPILYLDESSANLDAHSTAMVRRVLRELAAGGGTALLTTHNPKEVEAVSDRVAVLCRGRLVALDTPRALRDRYGGNTVDATLPDGTTAGFDLADPAERAALAALVAGGEVAALHSRGFGFSTALGGLIGTDHYRRTK